MLARYPAVWTSQPGNNMKLQSTWKEGEEEGDLPDLFMV